MHNVQRGVSISCQIEQVQFGAWGQLFVLCPQSVDVLAGVITVPQLAVGKQHYLIVGVTRNLGESPATVVFWADKYNSPYIKTKPIHLTQQVIAEVADGTHFSIDVIPNFELERELMGFGEGLKVLSPAKLVRRIKRKVQLMYQLYNANE